MVLYVRALFFRGHYSLLVCLNNDNIILQLIVAIACMHTCTL